jgi:hypothetical protein
VRDKHLVGWAICVPGGPTSTGLSSQLRPPGKRGRFSARDKRTSISVRR